MALRVAQQHEFKAVYESSLAADRGIHAQPVLKLKIDNLTQAELLGHDGADSAFADDMASSGDSHGGSIGPIQHGIERAIHWIPGKTALRRVVEHSIVVRYKHDLSLGFECTRIFGGPEKRRNSGGGPCPSGQRPWCETPQIAKENASRRRHFLNTLFLTHWERR